MSVARLVPGVPLVDAFTSLLMVATLSNPVESAATIACCVPDAMPESTNVGIVCVPTNVFAASVRATVADVDGNVIVVPSVPASVRVFDDVNVLPAAIESVPVPVAQVLPFHVVPTTAPKVCVPVKVLAASVRAIVAEVVGNVIVVLSVPANVSVFDEVNVLPDAIDKLPSAMITLLLAPSGAFSSEITPLNCELVVAANCDNGLVVSASPLPPTPPKMGESA